MEIDSDSLTDIQRYIYIYIYIYTDVSRDKSLYRAI